MVETYNGKIEGDKTIHRDLSLSGMITGSATVAQGIVFELRGTVIGNLVVERDALVHVYGTVCGDATNNGGHLNVFGTIMGRVFKRSGATHVDARAIVAGGVR